MRKALAVVGAVAALVAFSPAAQADGPFPLRNVATGHCLDARNGDPHIPVQVRPCDGGKAQKWFRDNVNGQQRLRPAINPTVCLDGSLPGFQTSLSLCEPAQPVQFWDIKAHSDGSASLRNTGVDGQCLAAADRAAVLWDCAISPDQRWIR